MLTKKRVWTEEAKTSNCKKQCGNLESMLANLSLQKRKANDSLLYDKKKPRCDANKPKDKTKVHVKVDNHNNIKEGKRKRINKKSSKEPKIKTTKVNDDSTDEKTINEKSSNNVFSLKDKMEDIASFFYKSPERRANVKRLLEGRAQVVKRSFHVIHEYIHESRLLFFEHLELLTWTGTDFDWHHKDLDTVKGMVAAHRTSLSETKIQLDSLILMLYEMRDAVTADFDFTSQLPC